jgi:glycosyltransferase involved in cell wall biosynthesis
MGHYVTIIARGSGDEVIRKRKWGVNTFFFPGWRTQWLNRLPFILETNFDIIHIFASVSFCNSIPGLFSKLFKRVHLVVDWDDWWTKGGLTHSPIDPILVVMEEKVILFASATTVVSDALRYRVLGCGAKNVFKIENGSNVEDIKVMGKNESRRKLKIGSSPIILYMGWWETDVAFLVEVVKNVRKTLPDVKLMVIGMRHSNSEEVSYIGHVAYDMVQYYLAAADILCIPMSNDFVGKARWPIKLGDYMASGRPIVGCNVGEVGRILAEVDNRLVANPEDPSDMASRIVMLLRDEQQRDTIGHKIRKLAETRYAWSLMADRLEKVYRKIMLYNKS